MLVCAARWPALGKARRSPAPTSKQAPRSGPKPGHRLDDRGLGVLVEGISDLGVEAAEALVQREDVGGELGDDACGEVLAGEHRHLGTGSGDGLSGDAGGVAHLALAQPCGQPRVADAADPVWAGITGQQHERTLAGRVVERSFQAGNALVIRSRSRLIIRTRSATRSARWPVSTARLRTRSVSWSTTARSRRRRAVSAIT